MAKRTSVNAIQDIHDLRQLANIVIDKRNGKRSALTLRKSSVLMLSQLSDLIVAGTVCIMLFFTVAVAPTIFIVLPAKWAAA